MINLTLLTSHSVEVSAQNMSPDSETGRLRSCVVLGSARTPKATTITVSQLQCWHGYFLLLAVLDPPGILRLLLKWWFCAKSGFVALFGGTLFGMFSTYVEFRGMLENVNKNPKCYRARMCFCLCCFVGSYSCCQCVKNMLELPPLC